MIKKSKLLIIPVIIFGLFLSGLVSTVASDPVLADTTSDAKAFCDPKYPGSSSKAKKNRVACRYGYEKGYNKSDGNDCGKYASKIRGTYAACKVGKIEGLKVRNSQQPPATGAQSKSDCAGVGTFFNFNCAGSNKDKGGRENPIVSLMLTALSWATGLVAFATVGAIIYGGILYTTAQDNASQTQKGIMYVVDSVIGLVLWLSAYVLINFIVPGGLFT